MKITKRQLRRIIKEELNILLEMGGYAGHHTGNNLEGRLNSVWDIVRADTLSALGGQASWEEISEEVMASGYSVDPDLMEKINQLSSRDQDKLFKKTFAPGSTW